MRNKIIYILLVLIVLSCKTTEVPEEDIIVTPVEPPVVEPVPPTKEEILNNKVDDYLTNMSLEEKIGQLFILDVRGHINADNKVITLLNSIKPGGIIFFSNNIVDNEQVISFIDELQVNSQTPLFISVDEEGGLVSRLGKAKGVDVTYLPPALTVGNKNNYELAYNTGKILGRELKALGFNMDMAPDADVNTNPQNPVIGNRTYSADPYIAGEMVSNVIAGFQEENMIAVIKHFPGHGDTSTDTHLGTVVSPHNRERLDQIEFVPFKMGIEAGVDVIMTAHMTMPGITTTPLPATLNPEIISGILRDDFGFDGIVTTDAMDMGAITHNFNSAEAAVLAIKAGVDIILIPANPINAYNGLLESVSSGEISEDRIDVSVRRIIKLKFEREIMDSLEKKESIYDVKNDPAHQALIQTIFN